MTLIKSILIYRSSSAISGNTLQEVLTLGNDGGGLQIKNIADPTAAQDAATKSYVDAIASGIVTSWKAPVKAATTANITLSGAQTIDGISIIAGDRVLVKDQTTGSENGIYVCAAGAWARSTDADTASEVEGMALTVQQGTSNADTTWLQTADNVTLGTTSLVFTQIGASVPDATSSVKGKAKLYSDLSASNTDGSVTQAGIKTVTDAKWTAVDASESVKGIAEIATQTETNTGTDDTRVVTPLKLKNQNYLAPLASPTFTGTPEAPTAAQGTNTTQLATTAFVQAEVTILETLINGGYTDVAFVNSFSGVDYTGATDSKTGLQAAMASGKKVIVFDGLYRTTDILTLNTGQTVILRGGAVIELYGNVNTGVALFAMANKSSIIAEPGARLTHTPTGTASYSGIYVDTKYQWAILGKMTIEKFGNQGIRVQGTASSPNQYRNGIIKDVICRDNINNGFGGASGAGHGIEVTTADYVFILDVDCYDNQGYGVYFDRVANSPINNTRIIHNTLGGLRIDGDYAANTDHFHVSNCQINHNDTASTWNVHVKDVDTGVNFNGCSVYGGNPFKVENSRGVSFNGCGLTTGTAVGSVVVTPGDKGDGIVKINGGHVLYSTKAMTTYTSGGGTVIMDNVMETVITPLYTSNFSAGVDTFTDSGTTSTGNNDGVSDGTTSFDNCLRIAGDGASSTHYAIRATTLTVGNRYKVYVTAYMPTANTAVDGLEIGDSGPTYINPPGQAKGKWITYEAEFTAAGTSLQIKMKSGTSDTFTAPTTDYIYISRILIKTL